MISIHNFGWRLGNQLFQIACAKSLAEDNLDEVAYPEWKYAKYFQGDFTPKTSQVDYIAQENGFHYRPIQYKRNLAIDGYRQSASYFENNDKLIRQMFSLKPEYEKYVHIIPSLDIVAIHVRRGDYLIEQNKPFFYELNMDYYNYAISIMRGVIDEPYFFIFSDDLQWCEDNFPKSPEFTIAGSSDEMEDFAKMKNCPNFIIGNSSFSWWAAYLNTNPNKVVIAPNQSHWFGPALSHYDTSDLIPFEWIRI